MVGFNTYVDASNSVADDKREEKWESLYCQKINEVHLRLSKQEGALEHLRDYEEMEMMAKILKCVINSDWLGASSAADKIIIKQATYEAEKEYML